MLIVAKLASVTNGEEFGIEAGPVLVHLAAEIVAVVREQVDDHRPAAGFEDAGGFANGGGRIGDVGQGQDDQGRIAGSVVDGDRISSPRRSSTLERFASRRRAALSMAGELSMPMTRWTKGARSAAIWPAPSRGRRRPGWRDRSKGGGGEVPAVELAAETVPFPGGAGEEGLAVAALLEKSLEAELVLHDGGPAVGLLARRARGGGRAGPVRRGSSDKVGGPSFRPWTQPRSPRTFRWRLMVDCGRWRMSQSSATPVPGARAGAAIASGWRRRGRPASREPVRVDRPAIPSVYPH